ncbi:MAG TPA: TetR/AcrR family transcriptional regulator [Euzebyales bacterium]
MSSVTPQEETRDRLIAAARAVIDRSGLRGARMEDIAAEAGVSRAAVYYHFSSKDALAAALVDDIFRGLVATVRTALSDGPVDQVVRASAAFFKDQVALARLLLTEMPTPVEPEHIMGRHRDELLGMLRERLRTDMRDGRVRRCDVDVAAAALAGLMRVAPFEMLAGSQLDLTYLTDELCAFVRHALAPPDRAVGEPSDAGADPDPTPAGS